jgi:hypothetical protein
MAKDILCRNILQRLFLTWGKHGCQSFWLVYVAPQESRILPSPNQSKCFSYVWFHGRVWRITDRHNSRVARLILLSKTSTTTASESTLDVSIFIKDSSNVSLIMQSMWQMADFSHLPPVSPLRFTVTQSTWFTLTYAFLYPSASATLAIFKDMRKKRIGDPRKGRHNEKFTQRIISELSVKSLHQLRDCRFVLLCPWYWSQLPW